MALIPNSNKRIHFASVSLLLILALTGCGPQSSLESSADELEFTGLISGSEECSTYPYGDSISLQTEFINTTAQQLNEDSFSQLQEQGYRAAFFQNDYEIDGFVLVVEDKIDAGQLGTMYLAFTRADLDEAFANVTRIQILKDNKVLLDSEVDIDLGALCPGSEY